MVFKLYGIPRKSAASGPRPLFEGGAYFVPNAALIRVNKLYRSDSPYSLENILSDPFVLPNGTKLSSLLYADDLIVLDHDQKQDCKLSQCVDSVPQSVGVKLKSRPPSPPPPICFIIGFSNNIRGFVSNQNTWKVLVLSKLLAVYFFSIKITFQLCNKSLI